MSRHIATECAFLLACRTMNSKEPQKEPGTWIFKAIPRELMQRAKIAAAVEGRTVKDMVISLIETHLREMEKKGQLPKGKG